MKITKIFALAAVIVGAGLLSACATLDENGNYTTDRCYGDDKHTLLMSSEGDSNPFNDKILRVISIETGACEKNNEERGMLPGEPAPNEPAPNEPAPNEPAPNDGDTDADVIV